jgi:hypothetical protein
MQPALRDKGGSLMKFRFLAASVFFLFPAISLAQEVPSFLRDVRPFLKKYCMECHRSGKVKGGLNLESYPSIMKGSKRGRKVVIPGQPDQSRLVRTIEHQTKPYMPPRNSAQPREKDIAMLRAWIKAGAKDDSAKSAFFKKAIEQEATEKTENWLKRNVEQATLELKNWLCSVPSVPSCSKFPFLLVAQRLDGIEP